MINAHVIDGVPGTLKPANNDGSGATWTSEFRSLGNGERIRVCLRYSRLSGNASPSFGITADIFEGRRRSAGGCCHEEITEAFPELAYFIGFHLMDDEGPLHYLANTTYHAQNGDIDAARRSAHWQDASLDELSSKTALTRRLPDLLKHFHAAMKNAGIATDHEAAAR